MPTLATLSAMIPRESYILVMVQGYIDKRNAYAGRYRIDPVILSKIMALEQLFNLRVIGPPKRLYA